MGLVVAVTFAVARCGAGASAASATLGQLARGSAPLVHLALLALLPLSLLLFLDFLLSHPFLEVSQRDLLRLLLLVHALCVGVGVGVGVVVVVGVGVGVGVGV